MNDVNGNRKLFWKEVSNAERGKVESCSRIKDGYGKMKCEISGRSILKTYII